MDRAIWWCREAPRRAALAARTPHRGTPSVRFFPPLMRESEFLDLYFKILHFMPPGSASRITIPVDFVTTRPLNDLTRFPPPLHVAAPPAGIRRDVAVVRERSRSLARALLCADLVYVWDWSAVPAGSVAAESPRVCNVDRHRNGADAWTWAEFLYNQWPPAQRAAEIAASRQRLRDALARLPRYDRAYVFGTGPSLEQAWQHDFSDGYRIVCNTIVNNSTLMDHINPHLVVAGDAAYHFDVNRHAVAFQRDLEAAMRARDLLFVTRDLYAPLLAFHHPDTRRRTLLAESGVPGIHFTAPERIVYHQWPHGNILNALLLPLGSSLANDVTLLGFDGRAPGEKAFWQNSPLNTYDAYKPAIREAHPAFFEIDFEAYAQAHSDNAEQLMQAGEAMGKRYRCLNDSYIPAFRKRRVEGLG